MHTKLVTIFLEVISFLDITIFPSPLCLQILLKANFSLLGIMFHVPMAALVFFLFFGLYLPSSSHPNTCFFLHGSIHTWVVELNFFAFECDFQAKASQTCQILRIIWGCSFQIHIRISGPCLGNSDYLNCSVLGVL